MTMTAIALPTVPRPVSHPTHPQGRRARVLLTSVFGPYCQDDEFGSRRLNPMELYHNQVTRTQGPFSLRMFHRSWGLMMIQANIHAPCVVLDFPVLERLEQELRSVRYDVIGITSIIPNVGKVAHMCKLIRQLQPHAQIVIGGHVANMPGVGERVDCDHVARGDGIRWMREYLGQDPEEPLRHPYILSGLGGRTMGVHPREKPGDTAASVIPSVGCPLGCNFCATSAMFGGKGKCVHFFETGDELFHIMCELEEKLHARSFFMMDENFLIHRQRALRVLELMEQHHKSWALYVFTSANVLRSYSIDQLVRLGISWVWMGLEGKQSQYTKIRNIDTHELVREMQSHGIKVLGSSIIGLEHHTLENIDEHIAYAAAHNTDFHQFMLYTPIPGTPLHAEHRAKGDLLSEAEIAPADVHGQDRFNYRHAHLPPGSETQLLVRAFDHDFQTNGPSVLRLARTTLLGYQRYKNHPDARVRDRYRWEARDLGSVYPGAIKAALKHFKHNPGVTQRLKALLSDLYAEFGFTARLRAPLVAAYLGVTLNREAKRLAAGWHPEPPTFYECNEHFQPDPQPAHGQTPRLAQAIAPQRALAAATA